MSHNLSEKCHHCGSKKGEFCKATCPVNGQAIIDLNKALSALDLKREGMMLIVKKSYGRYSHKQGLI